MKRKQDQVRFIAGLIAQARPSISDCGLIARHIVEVASEKHIDPFYVAAVISVESRFSTTARSRVGARGLMQLMPQTARSLTNATPEESVKDSLNDPRLNIELGIDYLKHLETIYHGDRTLVLAAYNWGPTNLAKVKKEFQRAPKSVQRYANTIIERTQNWQRHYLKAHSSAAQISHFG
jgi:soluble lytic murein transglycosylase